MYELAFLFVPTLPIRNLAVLATVKCLFTSSTRISFCPVSRNSCSAGSKQGRVLLYPSLWPISQSSSWHLVLQWKVSLQCVHGKKLLPRFIFHLCSRYSTSIAVWKGCHNLSHSSPLHHQIHHYKTGQRYSRIHSPFVDVSRPSDICNRTLHFIKNTIFDLVTIFPWKYSTGSMLHSHFFVQLWLKQ